MLSELLKKHDLKAVEASKRTGIPPSQWSRWLSGDQIFMSDEDYETVARVLFKDPQEQAQILRSRLLHICHGPGSELVEIKIRNEPPHLHEPAPAYKTKLPAKIQKDLDTIAANITTDKGLREVVHSLASYSQV